MPTTSPTTAASTPTATGDPEDWFSDPEYINGHYVDSILVCGQQLSGREVRENLLEAKINSAAFEVDYSDGVFTFTTYGYGHGVGMSQQGADYYAMQAGTMWTFSPTTTPAPPSGKHLQNKP